jgi:DcmR-like sensory protein
LGLHPAGGVVTSRSNSIGLVSRERPPIAEAIRGTVHAVQFYDTDDYLLQTLSDYVAGAFAAGDAAIVVATEAHRAALDEHLIGRGIDILQKRETGSYLALDASELLSRFTIEGSISPTRFADIVGSLIARARGESSARQVRVFAEMVALLWAEGDRNGALVLKELWNDLTRRMSFPLLCAYPASVFSTDAEAVVHVADISSHEPRSAAAK